MLGRLCTTLAVSSQQVRHGRSEGVESADWPERGWEGQEESWPEFSAFSSRCAGWISSGSSLSLRFLSPNFSLLKEIPDWGGKKACCLRSGGDSATFTGERQSREKLESISCSGLLAQCPYRLTVSASGARIFVPTIFL